MLRTIGAVAGCAVLLAAPARAEKFSYTCAARASGTEINFTADLSSNHGGTVTGVSGSLAVKDSKLEEKLSKSDVTQTWTSDTAFNIQFGSDNTKWTLIVQTNCPKKSKSCRGTFVVAFEKDKSREGAIACTVK